MPEVKKKKTKAGSGKSKGGGFEREVSSKLSLWFSEGTRDDIFYRSHSSGGRFTMRRKTSKDTAYQSGDITCSDPIGKVLIDNWSIECKTGYGKWDLLDLLDSNQKVTQIEAFFKQCKEDSDECNKHPILVFRRAGRKICICIEKKYFSYLKDLFGEYGDIYISIYMNNLVVMKFDDFLNWADPSYFKGCSNDTQPL